MKKLLLSAFLGVSSLVAFAGDKGTVTNLLACGVPLTVQYIQYDPGTCVNNGMSPVYPVIAGNVHDLGDKNFWLPTTLQSYQSYSAIICIHCPGFPPICLPPVGITPGPPPCDPTTQGPVATPCCGNVSVTNNPPGGGGIDWNLDVF